MIRTALEVAALTIAGVIVVNAFARQVTGQGSPGILLVGATAAAVWFLLLRGLRSRR
jgi:hypothetical protein